MDLPPDKAKLLKSYDNEKKWDIICDQVRCSSRPRDSPANRLFSRLFQEMVQAKDPPSHYLTKLRTYLDPKASRSHRVSFASFIDAARSSEFKLIRGPERSNAISHDVGHDTNFRARMPSPGRSPPSGARCRKLCARSRRLRYLIALRNMIARLSNDFAVLMNVLCCFFGDEQWNREVKTNSASF